MRRRSNPASMAPRHWYPILPCNHLSVQSNFPRNSIRSWYIKEGINCFCTHHGTYLLFKTLLCGNRLVFM
jgi:hypothetical protein